MKATDGSGHEPTSDRQVLFLDFDGVMHRFGALRTRRGIISDKPSVRLFEFAPVLVECLKPYPRLEIVLSTSWVRALGYQRAKNVLPAELRERVVGATYHSRYHDAWKWPAIARGIQILRYVRVHRLQRWLAVDDCTDGFDGFEEHVVKCDEHLGLGDSKTRDLLQRRLAEQFGER